MTTEPILPKWAARIWEVLAAETGADGSHEPESFITTQADGCTEYRFGGWLGFGGKFWNYAGRWYVTCYPEDLTADRRAVLAVTNRRLDELRTELVSSSGA